MLRPVLAAVVALGLARVPSARAQRGELPLADAPHSAVTAPARYATLTEAAEAMQRLTEQRWPTLHLRGTASVILPGTAHPLIPRIRERLLALGDLAALADGADETYAPALVAAVQRFQWRHGLPVDGAIGSRTIAALNVSPARRLRTLRANLARRSPRPESSLPRALLVNIPDFRLSVIEQGRELFAMPVVVGARVTKTPAFVDAISSITFSPTWTVPESITRKELLPAMRRDSTYLARNHMDIIGGTADLPIIRQRPGPHNALGFVKFSPQRTPGIFLHDTPVRSVFAREQRALSHGCIRLGEPVALARYLLQDDAEWPDGRMAAAMQGGEETVVPLRRPIPLFVIYATAWIDAEGRLHFRDDIYRAD